jgi:hypothetical protein
MGITLQEASEVVTGLVLTGKISPSVVRTDLLFPPYNDIIRSEKSCLLSREELILKYGIGAINPPLEAVKNLNGMSSADWLGILEQSAMRHQMGIRMEKLSKKLQRGDEIDDSEIRHIANQFSRNATGRVQLSKIQETEVPFIKTGSKAIDVHLGGFPVCGLIVIGGDSSVGKTTFARDVSIRFATEHPDKRIAFYSLEMMLPEIAGRFRESGNGLVKVADRIEINADVMTAEDIVADASGMDNLGLVLIDFADMLIRGETTEAKMSEIYLTFALAAKQLEVPILLFCQFNKTYQGGLPRPSHIRWTGMAKILSWMQLMLYRPADDSYSIKDDDKLPVISDIGYIIAWKIRGGFRQHKDESPGAIQMRFDGVLGWDMEHSKWFNLKNA